MRWWWTCKLEIIKFQTEIPCNSDDTCTWILSCTAKTRKCKINVHRRFTAVDSWEDSYLVSVGNCSDLKTMLMHIEAAEFHAVHCEPAQLSMNIAAAPAEMSAYHVTESVIE